MTLSIEPFPFGIDQSRRNWDDLLKSYGDIAILRQAGIPDRYVTTVVATFTTQERLGGLSNPADRKMLVSAISPETGMVVSPEPSQRDTLITLRLNSDGSPVLDTNGNVIEDERLRLIAPVGRAGPSRAPLYWRLAVRA